MWENSRKEYWFMTKQEIRKEILKKRNSLDLEYVEEHSQIVFDKLLKSGVLDKYNNIFIIKTKYYIIIYLYYQSPSWYRYSFTRHLFYIRCHKYR